MLNLIQQASADNDDLVFKLKAANFVGNKNWWKGFKKRMNIVKRKVTTKNQIIPNDYKAPCDNSEVFEI